MPKVAVIGSGFGGLAIAIRLQANGFDVHLFEKRDRPGGRAYVYEQQGFTFDAGPTVITDPSCLEELFTLSNRNIADYVTLEPIQPFYRLYWEDGYQFDYTNDDDLLYNQIKRKNPDDEDGYRRFLAYTEEVFEEGYLKLGHVPFLDFRSMLQAAPQLIRLQSYRSVYSMVAKFIKDEQLRQAFSFHTLLVGGNPFTTSAIYTLIHPLERKWGVLFARGGTGALVQGLAKLFQDLGGSLHLEQPIQHIQTSNGAIANVITNSGEKYDVDLVVSNADVVHTYDRLLSDNPIAAQTTRQLKRKRFSPSLFVTYFGVKKIYDNLCHHSILFGPRYKDLIGEIYNGPDLADDFSLYLHAPSVTDPSLAPDGCMTFYALSPVPNLGTTDIDWAQFGETYQNKILDYLDQRYLPGLKENLVTASHFSPTDFKTELNAHLGSAFSLEPILTQSAYFRPHNRDANIKGLYIVGAGTHPGAGIPGVVGSAKATAGLIIEDFK